MGTGIGIGLVFNGKPVHGLVHGEGGHMKIKLHKSDVDFKGCCPYHEACLEDLCSNNSIVKRLGLESESELPALSDDHEVWPVIAYYLA